MAATVTLILLRHGESVWNKANLFTGWVDVDLTEQGEQEAIRSGELLAAAGMLPAVAHTSVQKRAIRTVNLALDACDRHWVPVRRHWRLNERHYGGLTGLDKAETARRHGADQVHVWRRSYDIPPPPIADEAAHNPNHDPQYAALPPEVIPRTECLADVVARCVPYWYDAIVPDLHRYRTVLVGAHGNSLRALVKHLDGIADDEIPALNIPTGIPLVYHLDGSMTPVPADSAAPGLSGAYLDPDAAAAGAAAVADQAG